MKLRVTFDDDSSMSLEEAVERAKHTLGENSYVEVLPKNNTPESFIYYGLQGLITLDQVNEYFDGAYNERLPMLRAKTLKTASSILDKVIIDNEEKLK